jgi:hypothetical protein
MMALKNELLARDSTIADLSLQDLQKLRIIALRNMVHVPEPRVLMENFG